MIKRVKDVLEIDQSEDYMTKTWRPQMAKTYRWICMFDFILFPLIYFAVQFNETEAANDAFRIWQPITLIGGGFIHMAFGAILGISAWTRGQEKIEAIKAGNKDAEPSAG